MTSWSEGLGHQLGAAGWWQYLSESLAELALLDMAAAQEVWAELVDRFGFKVTP